MTLSEELKTVRARTQSVVHKQLLLEDIARIERLEELAKTHPSYEAFEREGLFIGWTQGDFRTGELHAWLKPLLRSIHQAINAPSDHVHEEVRACWIAFNQERSKKLVGCL